MRELTRKEMLEIKGGLSFGGAIGRFFRTSEKVYAPSGRDALGEAKNLKENRRKDLFDNLSKADSRGRSDRSRERHAGDRGKDNR